MLEYTMMRFYTNLLGSSMQLLLLSLTLVHPYGHFCPFQLFFFFHHFACVKANCKKLGTSVCFYWNFTISPSFS